MFNIRSLDIDRPPIGQIIKDLREYRGMSQETLARAALFNRSTLSQIELGNIDCPDDLLLALKTALDVEYLPLRELERLDFQDMLHKWYSVISERKLEEAKKIQEKLSVVKLIPHDRELNLLYSLFECRLFLGLNQLADAKVILDSFDDSIDELNETQLYHYYCNQGTFNVRSKHNREALDYYLKAYALMKFGFDKNIILYFNIAICYSRLGFSAHAASFLEEASKVLPDSPRNVPEFSIWSSLAVRYIELGALQRAKMLLDKCHELMSNDYKTSLHENSNTYLGIVLLNYGYLYRKSRKWIISIEYLNKSLELFDKEDVNYLESLYQKIRCYIEMGNILPCTAFLSNGLRLSEGNELYSIMFKSLQMIISLNDESAKYLENNILPYLLESRELILALDYTMVLRDYYKTKGRGFKIKALALSDTACSITDDMYEGGVVE